MSKTFTASQIATDMNLNPKKVRAILRKNGYQRPGTRWTFDNSDKPKIRALLRDATKAKAAPRRSRTVDLPLEEGAALH